MPEVVPAQMVRDAAWVAGHVLDELREGYFGLATAASQLSSVTAGTPIGMTDYQQGVPIRGDYMFYPYTWHSIELNATYKVPEWGGQAVRFPLEEDAALMPDGKWDWVDGRQTEYYLIK